MHSCRASIPDFSKVDNSEAIVLVGWRQDGGLAVLLLGSPVADQKMNKHKYEQGDVVLSRTDYVSPSFNSQSVQGSISLTSDIDGHAYRLVVENGAEPAMLYWFGNTKLVRVTESAVLKHPRYKDVPVMSGLYKVRKHSSYLHAEHGRRVSQYALWVGRALGFDEKHLAELEFASRIHDVGFVGCEEVLWQTKWFEPDDWARVQQHPVRGAKIMGPLIGRRTDATERAQKYVLYHHEHLDGSGYPYGIAGDEIPLGARILLIVDAFEAMTSWRPFREPLPEHVAMNRLREDAGYRYDGELVEIFSDALDELAIAELVG